MSVGRSWTVDWFANMFANLSTVHDHWFWTSTAEANSLRHPHSGVAITTVFGSKRPHGGRMPYVTRALGYIIICENLEPDTLSFNCPKVSLCFRGINYCKLQFICRESYLCIMYCLLHLILTYSWFIGHTFAFIWNLVITTQLLSLKNIVSYLFSTVSFIQQLMYRKSAHYSDWNDII